MNLKHISFIIPVIFIFFITAIFVKEFHENFVESFGTWVIIIIDIATLINGAMNLLQSALLTIFAASTSSLIYCLCFNDLNRKFNSLFVGQKQYFSHFSLWQLRFICFEHNRLTGYIICTDRLKWSMSLCQFLMVGIPMNVCFMCVLIFGHPSQSEKFLYIFITVLHAFSSILPTASLAHIYNYIKQIRKYITIGIPYLRHFRLKLKYDDLYGRLMYGKPYCFTFGYIGPVTYTTLSQVCINFSIQKIFQLILFLSRL